MHRGASVRTRRGNYLRESPPGSVNGSERGGLLSVPGGQPGARGSGRLSGPPSAGSTSSRGSVADAARAKRWPVNMQVRYGFLYGATPEQEDIIERAVEEWLKHIGLDLRYSDVLEHCQVRITFSARRGTWSREGTDCLRVPKEEATMNFAQLDYGTALREFGRVLGLVRKSNELLDYHKERARRRGKDTAGTTLASINMIASAARRRVVPGTGEPGRAPNPEQEQETIMNYSMTVGATTLAQPAVLSQSDVDFVSRLYPKRRYFQSNVPFGASRYQPHMVRSNSRESRQNSYRSMTTPKHQRDLGRDLEMASQSSRRSSSSFFSWNFRRNRGSSARPKSSRDSKQSKKTSGKLNPGRSMISRLVSIAGVRKSKTPSTRSRSNSLTLTPRS